MNTEVSSFWVFQGGSFSLIYMKRPYCVILLISDGSVKQKTNSHNQRKKYKKAMPYQNFFFFTFVTFVTSFFCPKNVVTEFFLAVLVFPFFRFSFPFFVGRVWSGLSVLKAYESFAPYVNLSFILAIPTSWSVLHLSGRCKKVFCDCSPLFFVTFYVAELTRLFLWSQNIPNCCFGLC